MDKFLVKTPRMKCEKAITTASSSRPLKQKTIPSLPRVVVLEDIRHLKCKLGFSNQSKEVLLSSLKELGKKIPPRNVFLETKIGDQVKRLRTHSDEDVSREAKKVYCKWQTYFKKCHDRPQIVVKCDKKTENLRQRGKTFFSKALGLEKGHELVATLETEVFHQHQRLVNHAYCRTIRSLVLKLKTRAELRIAVLNKELSVEDLVKQNRRK